MCGDSVAELTAAEKALADGNTGGALAALRAVLEYPGRLATEEDWRQWLELLVRFCDAIEAADLAERARPAAGDPSDAVALYWLGYELVESQLPGIAATVLSRANYLCPGEEDTVNELACALENDFRNAEACRILRSERELTETTFMTRYLLAFNSVMAGDLDSAHALLPRLLDTEDSDQLVMARRIEEMLLRTDAVRGVSPLDDRDLRGWHFAINGSILLHLSPHALDEGMNGRYAFTQDLERRCHEGILRLRAALDALGCRPPRVLVLPERESAILAEATARLLGLPKEPWPPGYDGHPDPGLIVVYDLGRLEKELFCSVGVHRPGQVLWSHASCWTVTQPFTPDVTTYLYQANHSPWGERIRLDLSRREPVWEAPSEEPVEDLTARIVEAVPRPEELADIDALERLARQAATVKGLAAAGALQSEGFRRKGWLGSPVSSAMFDPGYVASLERPPGRAG